MNKLSNRIKATQRLISLYKESQRLLVLLENTSDDDLLAIKYLTEEIYKVSMKIKETENEQYNRLAKLFERYHLDTNQIEFIFEGYRYWITWSGRAYRKRLEGLDNKAVRISQELFQSMYNAQYGLEGVYRVVCSRSKEEKEKRNDTKKR